jgi:hypothetical protein
MNLGSSMHVFELVAHGNFHSRYPCLRCVYLGLFQGCDWPPFCEWRGEPIWQLFNSKGVRSVVRLAEWLLTLRAQDVIYIEKNKWIKEANSISIFSTKRSFMHRSVLLYILILYSFKTWVFRENFRKCLHFVFHVSWWYDQKVLFESFPMNGHVSRFWPF